MENETELLEKKFLSYILQDKLYISKAMSRMDKKYFKYITNIYRLVIAYYNKYRDVISDDMLERKIQSLCKSTDDVIITRTIVSDAKNFDLENEAEFEALTDEIIEKYKRRQLIRISETILNRKPNSCETKEVDDIKSDVQKIIVEIDSTDYDVEREGALEDDADERLQQYNHIKEHPEDIKLFKTGFQHIDDAIVGWDAGSLNIACGRKGDGKSVCLLNIGYHLWKQNKNVLFFSLEIDRKQYARRWDARAALVSSKGLKAGNLSEEEEKTYKEYIELLRKKKDFFNNDVGSVYIVDCSSNVNPAFISSKTEEIERKTGIVYDAVIVDYLGIMTANSPTGILREDLGAISLDLKRYAREKKKMLFSAVQLNRARNTEMTKKGGGADTDGIANSDMIADNADTVFVIKSLDDSVAIFESAKTRDGSTFSFRIQKNYDKMQMIEIDDSEWDEI